MVVIESPSELRDIRIDELERECADLREDAARLRAKLTEARDEVMRDWQELRASIECRATYMDDFFKSLMK